MLIQIHANKSCLKLFGVGMLKNVFGQFGKGTLKLTVSQA